jgi:mycoredoxin
VAEKRRVIDAVVEVYWRPRCLYCFRLRQALFRARVPVKWRNIRMDARHARFVRAAADGTETVPTVVLAGAVHVNPAPRDLLDMIEQAHPELERLPSFHAARQTFRRTRRR